MNLISEGANKHWLTLKLNTFGKSRYPTKVSSRKTKILFSNYAREQQIEVSADFHAYVPRFSCLWHFQWIRQETKFNDILVTCIQSNEMELGTQQE